MANTPTLYHWALVDKTGKTRLTCTAKEDLASALAEFKHLRLGHHIPEGWSAIKRGHLTPVDRHKDKMETSGPRKLQVFDRVKRINTANGEMVPVGSTGTIVSEEIHVTLLVVMWDHIPDYTGNLRHCDPKNLELIQEPKKDEPNNVVTKALHQRIAELEKERDSAHREFADLHQRARRAEQLVEAETAANQNAIGRLRDLESMRDQLRVILNVPLGTSLITAAEATKAKLDETRGFLDSASKERDDALDLIEKIRALLIVEELGRLDQNVSVGDMIRIELGIKFGECPF
jgi:hypothetical protein